MAFHDIRLPEDIERGALGGPMFKTTVHRISSGFEKRNKDWQDTRAEYDVGYGLLRKDGELPADTDLNKLRDFFFAREGRFHSFRFKDFADFEIGDPANPTVTNQQIALGDDATTVFQTFKRYASGSQFHDRTIVKLVSGQVNVLLDGVLQADPGDYTADLLTGIITFVVAPASTGGSGPGGEEVVQVALEYDVHVRFDDDHWQVNMQLFNAGSVPNVPIVELRGAD